MIDNLANIRSQLRELQLSDLPEEIDSLADLLVEIELTFEQMKRSRNYLKQELSVRLADRGVKVAHSRNELVKIRQTNRISRTKLKRESLMNHLRERCNKEVTDVETGEIVTLFDEKQFMEIYLECFLPQPRWAPLKSYGVKDEDFCTVETKSTVSYSGLKQLINELLPEIEPNAEEEEIELNAEEEDDFWFL